MSITTDNTETDVLTCTVAVGDTLVDSRRGRNRLIDVKRIKNGIAKLKFRNGKQIPRRVGWVNDKLADNDFKILLGTNL